MMESAQTGAGRQAHPAAALAQGMHNAHAHAAAAPKQRQCLRAACVPAAHLQAALVHMTRAGDAHKHIVKRRTAAQHQPQRHQAAAAAGADKDVARTSSATRAAAGAATALRSQHVGLCQNRHAQRAAADDACCWQRRRLHVEVVHHRLWHVGWRRLRRPARPMRLLLRRPGRLAAAAAMSQPQARGHVALAACSAAGGRAACSRRLRQRWAHELLLLLLAPALALLLPPLRLLPQLRAGVAS